MNAEPFPFQGELQELYASACVCAKQEVEVAVACFVYRMRHQLSDESRLKVSNDVLRALKAAGCISCKKISACSLGMYRQAQRQAADEYFGEWVAGLSFDTQGSSSYRGLVEAVVTRLQAAHTGRLQQQGERVNNNQNLSLHKLYAVFKKWTGQQTTGSSRPVGMEGIHGSRGRDEDSTVESGSVEEGATTGRAQEPSTTNKRKSITSPSAHSRPSPSPPSKRAKPKTPTPRPPDDDDDSSGTDEGEEEVEEEEEEEFEVGEKARSLRHPGKSGGGRTGRKPTPRSRSTPTGAIPSTKQTSSRTTTQPKAPPPPNKNLSSTQPQKQRSADTEEEEESGQEGKTTNEKHKLRSPFRPPDKEMRKGPCWSGDDGKTWQPLQWDKRHQLSKEAWIQPIRTFFVNERELQSLKEEDRGGKVKWRQDFETCYGVRWPIRHLDAFMATPEVEASVSHRDTGKEGHHLLLEKCGDIDAFPIRKALLARLNKEWRKDLGPGEWNFNAVQSNLYSGNFRKDDVSSSLDHIGFHKDGRCKVRGPPIVSGCYSNNKGEGNVAAFLVHHQQKPIRVWIPQTSGTGYALGGRHCHEKYYHGKFLFGDWRAYHHHVSITFSCYHPTTTTTTNKRGTNTPAKPRGIEVPVDWNLTAESRLWSRKYLLGQVPKSACHPEIQRLNAECILTSNYDTVWGAWDEFKNTSILQLLHLHPADGGQGIAGNKDHALSLLVMGSSEQYPNEVTVDRESSTLKVKYYTSDKGKRLLKKAKRDSILLRVFLSPRMPARKELFACGDPSAVLFLPLMTTESKDKDTRGTFFLLSATLSREELTRCVKV